MSIDGRTKQSIKSDVTAQGTKEGKFRDGMDNIIEQVDDNQVKLNRVTDDDLDKLNDVTAPASDLNRIQGFTGDSEDLNRAKTLNDAGDGTTNQLLTADGANGYKWTDQTDYRWQLMDSDGTIQIVRDSDYVQLLGTDGIDIDWTDTSHGSKTDPFDVTFSLKDQGIATEKYANNSIGAAALNVSGNGTNTQFLRSDADGTFSWAVPVDTTYTASTGLSLSGTAFSVSNGGVDTAQLANDAVTGAKVEDNAIANEHIAENAVDSEQIADDAVGVPQLSASGTASSTTFLRGDNTWSVATSGQYGIAIASGGSQGTQDGGVIASTSDDGGLGTRRTVKFTTLEAGDIYYEGVGQGQSRGQSGTNPDGISYYSGVFLDVPSGATITVVAAGGRYATSNSDSNGNDGGDTTSTSSISISGTSYSATVSFPESQTTQRFSGTVSGSQSGKIYQFYPGKAWTGGTSDHRTGPFASTGSSGASYGSGSQGSGYGYCSVVGSWNDPTNPGNNTNSRRGTAGGAARFVLRGNL